MPHTSFLSAIALAIVLAGVQQHHHDPAEKLGTVKFATSCSAEAQPAFLRAMALLHSFEFGPAIEGFTAAGKTDPSCAIAYWGIALSRWGNPFSAGNKTPSALEAGRKAIDQSKVVGAKTERERDYVAAAEKLFADFETVPQRARVVAYRDAMANVATKYPDDPEASAFYALALAASADPTDMTYANYIKAGEILERLAPTQPDHPGFVHYIIHVYDVPPLAPKALSAARSYAKIAPSAPHALHMPSHTFTRLGYWQESVDTNLASAEAARREMSVGEELHALDYQTYAYLQLAKDAQAKQVLDLLPGLSAKLQAGKTRVGAASPVAAYFALAAIPARYALERQAWSEAARMEVSASPYPHADAVSWFARGYGAARAGDVATAKTAIDKLAALEGQLTKANEAYWSEQAAIARLSVLAWTTLAEGRRDEALKTMQSAADREDRTEKNVVTPGPLAPAREQFGYMLLATNQPADALTAFETTLKKEPSRFLALAGAAESARKKGDAAASQSYAKQLLALATSADGPARPQLESARQAAKGSSR
jgi:hypothetical protein